MCDLLVLVAFHVLADPSAIKWLAVWPLICDLVPMGSIHTVFLDAVRFALDLTIDDHNDLDGDMSEMSEAEMLGVPAEDNDAWHRRERRRALKALRWIETRGTLHRMMLFLLTTGPVMKLHYSLFKYAQHSPFAEEKSYIFNLCDVTSSVVAKILGEPTQMLLSRRPWSLLESMMSVPVAEWPAAFTQTARDCVLALLGCQSGPKG